MSGNEFGALALPLLLLIASAQVLGYLFARARQPRVIGEILAGVVLGPSVLQRIAPGMAALVFPVAGSGLGVKYAAVAGFLSNLGLLLLMFASGAEADGLFRRDERRAVTWLGGVGTGLPFLIALAAAPFLPVGMMIGAAQQTTSLVLVVGIAVAVTSIPVISKILHDLDLLGTRFARLIIGVAVVEDILLWCVLAIALALAKSRAPLSGATATHAAISIAYFVIGLTVLPRAVRWVTGLRANLLVKSAPIAYVLSVLLAYAALAAALDVSGVFAAFLAGFAIVSDARLRPAAAALARVSFAVFIPVYFAMVGYQLSFGRGFSLGLTLGFIAAACVVKLASAGAGARLAGFSWRASANLSIALNARGGPGIVLATVAYDAEIINAGFYTTLVLLAIITSQMAGAWLAYVIRRGWPLLAAEPNH